MKVALYARVSTDDKGQDPETQLGPLREFSHANGYEPAGEFVDQASAGDMAKRTAWSKLLGLAAKRKVDLVLVWRMDRAFRSVLDGANTLARLRAWGVGLRSYAEPWLDTTTPFGEAMFNITVTWAQLERDILKERVRAGMDRARRQGKHVGRPKARFDQDKARQLAGQGLSIRKIAKALKASPASIGRCLKTEAKTEGQGTAI